MKIAIRGGHNYKVPGAHGIVDEVIEDRKIKDAVIKYLKQLGYEVLDVTPEESYIDTSTEDLIFGVSRANVWGSDYFCSVHLNAGGGQGTEVLYESDKGKEIAERISAKIASLGFKNRGSKPNTRGLYELRKTNAVANIIECFFSDSQVDVNLYKKVGVDAIALAIAEGITGQKIVVTKPMPLKVTNDMVAMGLDKNGQIYPVKEFKKNDLITVSRIVNRLGEVDINGVKAYITMGYTTTR